MRFKLKVWICAAKGGTTTLFVMLLFNFLHQVVAAKITLNSLRYEVDVTARLAETKVAAVFQNVGNKDSKEILELLVPENALVTSFAIKAKNRNYTSVIKEKKKRKRSKSEKILLHQRISQAQKLEVEVVLERGETLELQLGYTELFRRKRGLYHLILYLPSSEAQNLDLDIGIRVMGEMEELTFLKAMGGEEPLSVIQHGAAEIYSSSRKEVKLRYKRNVSISTPFSSVTHHNPTLGKDQPAQHLSFKPAEVPHLFLADPAYVMSFDVTRYPDGGGIQIQNGYFVHFISPEGLPKLPVHTVFVLDISGSMDELGKLANLKMAMTTTLQSLKQEDSFEIFVFSTNVNSLGIYTGSTKDIVRSISKINDLRAYGGTNINDALIESVYGANDYTNSKGAKQIVFLTDGNRTVGEMDQFVIRKNVKGANVDSLPIYALAFGDDADMKFLRQVSGENRGFARKIRSEGRPADQLRGFYKEISTPLLTDLSVSYGKNEVQENTLFKLGQDSFYSGDEVVISGKMKEGVSALTSHVNGTGASGRVQLKVSRKETLPSPTRDKSGVLERLWAYLAVQDLLTSQELIDDENLSTEMRARALEIAIKYNFVTRLTTLLISDPSHLLTDEPNNDEGFYNFYSGGLLTPVKEQIAQGLTLVSPEDFAATLPDGLQGSIPPSLNNRRYSFADNDPHFVVQVPGLALPICFDLHGQPGDILSLVRDDVSGLIVNAEVSAAIDRPGATYFTKLFISIKRLNLTVTTETITAHCNQGHEDNEVSEIWHEPDPFEQLKKLKARRRRTNLKSRRSFPRKGGQRLLTQKLLLKDLFNNIFKNFTRKTRSVRLRHSNGARCLYCERNRSSLKSAGSVRFRDVYEPEPETLLDPPVIDAYLEKDRKKESLLTRPHLKHSNSSWDEVHRYEGETIRHIPGQPNHYYSSPMFANNLIFRSAVTINDPKNDVETDRETLSECHKTLLWQRAARRRYDDVVFTVRGRRRRRRLDIIVGDLDLHVVVTNTRNKQGQAFLGFYIQEQKILSPTTTGVIGQFVYKSVGTIGQFPELATDPRSLESRSIPLAVVHLPQPGMTQTRVTKVISTVSKRRSLLHREKVLCLHVRKHGKGLLAKRAKDYLMPNLNS